VLAYIAWHLPAPAVRAAAFEQALERFHRSLAHRPPSGFRGSAAFRAPGLPWLADDAGPDPDPVSGGPGADSGDAGPLCCYEDWYLVDGWSAVGVLEEAAVARGHQSSHAAVAAMTGVTKGAIYRLIEGLPRLERAPLAVWVKRSPGHAPVTLEDLLADGMEGDAAGLWRRCLGLGPAPEYCLLAAEPPAGVSSSRLPAGWRATAVSRELVWSG
jgi:hypothetical protein